MFYGNSHKIKQKYAKQPHSFFGIDIFDIQHHDEEKKNDSLGLAGLEPAASACDKGSVGKRG